MHKHTNTVAMANSAKPVVFLCYIVYNNGIEFMGVVAFGSDSGICDLDGCSGCSLFN